MSAKQADQADRELYQQLRTKYSSSSATVRIPKISTDHGSNCVGTQQVTRLLLVQTEQGRSNVLQLPALSKGDIRPCTVCKGSKVAVELYNHRELEVGQKNVAHKTLAFLASRSCREIHLCRKHAMYVGERASSV